MLYQNTRRQISRVVRRLVSLFGRFDLSVVYTMNLAQPLKEYSARLPIDVSRASEADVDELVKLNPYHGKKVITERLRAGAKCFVARVEGRIVGFNWIAFGSVRDDEFIVNLNDGDVYCLDARVSRAYRGNGIHTELLFAMLAYAQERGFAHAYTRVSAMHRDSWKTHLRLGWNEIGTIYFFQPKFARNAARLFTGPAVYPVQVLREQPA